MSQADSTATLQGAQMALGRANKALETQNTELTAARSRLAELEQIVGNKMADGEDASAEVHAMQAAESLVKQLAIAVAVASQRQQEAESALKQSRTADRREALRGKLVQLADLGRMVDAQWAENGQLAAKAIALIGEVKSCSFGDPEINGKLVDARLYFRRTLLDTCEAMPGCWTGEDLFKTRRPWSNSLPTPDQADLVK